MCKLHRCVVKFLFNVLHMNVCMHDDSATATDVKALVNQTDRERCSEVLTGDEESSGERLSWRWR